MKKLNLFIGLLIGFMILSCSSDDDNSNSNNLIGTWKPIKEVDICSTGSEQVSEYSECRQTGRLTFSSNESMTVTVYEVDLGVCEQIYNANGTWTLNGDDLTITIAGETDSPTFFELTNNTLRIGYYDSDPNDPCDGENLPSHYFTEYTRVQ